MKKILIAIGLLVLVGCVTGLVLTYQALGKTEDTLQKTQDDVNSLQLELQDTQNDLTETRDELQDTATSLANTQNELVDQINETGKYINMYEGSLEEIEDAAEELETTTGILDSTRQDNEDLREEIDEIQEKLDLYEDTLGTTVYSEVLPPYNSGYLANLTLMNNVAAANPTWIELRAFLLEDKTDKNLYIVDEYMCGSYAEELHNNAEAAGIRAAFTVIHYYNTESHAINAFNTIDQGLVYIDVTGSKTPISLANLDMKARVVKDEIYQCSLIFPQAGWYVPPGDKVQGIEIYW